MSKTKKVSELMKEHGVTETRFSPPGKSFKAGSYQAFSIGGFSYFGKISKTRCTQCRKVSVLNGKSNSGYTTTQCLNGCVPVLSNALGRFGL